MSTNDTFTGLGHYNFLDSSDISELLFNFLTPMSNRQNININFALSLAFTLTATLNLVIIALIIAIFGKLKKISKKSFGCGKDLVKQLLHLLFSMDQIGNKLSSLLFHILSIVTELAFRQNQQSTALIQLFDVIRLLAFESHRDAHDPHNGINHGPPSLPPPPMSPHSPPPPPPHMPFIPFPFAPPSHSSHQPPHMFPHSLPPPPPPPPPSYQSSPNSFPPPPPPNFSPFPSSNQISLYPMSNSFNSTFSDSYMQPSHRLGVIYDD